MEKTKEVKVVSKGDVLVDGQMKYLVREIEGMLLENKKEIIKLSLSNEHKILNDEQEIKEFKNQIENKKVKEGMFIRLKENERFYRVKKVDEKTSELELEEYNYIKKTWNLSKVTAKSNEIKNLEIDYKKNIEMINREIFFENSKEIKMRDLKGLSETILIGLKENSNKLSNLEQSPKDTVKAPLINYTKIEDHVKRATKNSNTKVKEEIINEIQISNLVIKDSSKVLIAKVENLKEELKSLKDGFNIEEPLFDLEERLRIELENIQMELSDLKENNKVSMIETTPLESQKSNEVSIEVDDYTELANSMKQGINVFLKLEEENKYIEYKLKEVNKDIKNKYEIIRIRDNKIKELENELNNRELENKNLVKDLNDKIVIEKEQEERIKVLELKLDKIKQSNSNNKGSDNKNNNKKDKKGYKNNKKKGNNNTNKTKKDIKTTTDNPHNKG